MRREFSYRIVDVFTERALEGNALAVFPEASGMDDETMQRVARELNLAETVFVLPATREDCAARLRIFTPMRELAFAGHPTIGTGFVLLDEGRVAPGVQEFVLEEKIGPVPVRVEQGKRPMLWLTTPPIKDGDSYDPALCAEVLGLEKSDLMPVAPQILSAGNPTLFVALRDKEAVDRAWLDVGGARRLRGSRTEAFLTFVFTPTQRGAYSRMFAPDKFGVPEDPATGSATGPLAMFMMRHGMVSNSGGTRFVSEQGTKMLRRSFLHVLVHGQNGDNGIEVGGQVAPLARGTMELGI